jgi:hypothetical protein
MPFCPKCKQEYEADVKECADCMTVLVEQLDDAGEADAPQAAVFRAKDESALELMAAAVALHHVPIQRRTEVKELDLEGHLMLVPAEMGGRVAQILDHGLPMLIAEGEGSSRVYRIYEGEGEEEIRNPPLLEKPAALIVEMGEEAFDELMEIVARGDRPARHRAAYVLSQFGDEGVLALIKLLKVAVEKEQQETAMSLIKVLRDEVESTKGFEEFEGSLRGGSPGSKILALQAVTAFENEAAFPLVLPLLEDEDEAVRDEADNTLCILADEDMGFITEAPEAERREVIGRWKAWWEGRKHG